MDKTYWLHRTYVGPMYLNLDAKKNGLPVLMSQTEYNAVANRSDLGYIQALPHDLWLKEADEVSANYIQILTKAGISKEDYLKARQQNYQEQIDSYFKDGLYIQRPQLITTVTRLDEAGKNPQKELEKILKKDSFGFKTGNNLIGLLSNRQSLNVAIILEIPEACVSNENPQPVFENAKNTLSIGTTYFGVQDMTKVIPTQYIQGAFVVDGTANRLKFNNPNFDRGYVVKDGFYDTNAIDNYIKRQLSKDFDIENIYKTVLVLDDIFEKTKSKKCISDLKKVLDLVGRNLVTIEADELYGILDEKIKDWKRAVRTPMQVLSDELVEANLENSLEEEIINKIKNYITSSKKILKTKFDENPYDFVFVDELDSIFSALTSVSSKVYEKIQGSDSFNDVYGEVEIQKKLLTMKYEVNHKFGELIEESVTATPERQKEIHQENIALSNKVMFLNYAMSSDSQVAQKVLKILRTNDISRLSREECIKHIAQLENASKINNEKTL